MSGAFERENLITEQRQRVVQHYGDSLMGADEARALFELSTSILVAAQWITNALEALRDDPD